MTHHVSGVLKSCSPFKILDTVIGGIAIEVSAEESFGSWLVEGFENQFVDEFLFQESIVKADHDMAVVLLDGREDLALTLAAWE